MDKEKLLWKCDFCEKSFFNDQILGLHVKSNHKPIIEGWKKCEFCDKTYQSKKSLYQHVNVTHSKKINYECEICNKVFLNESNLNTHKKSVHKGIKPFQCNSCEYKFSTKIKSGPGPSGRKTLDWEMKGKSYNKAWNNKSNRTLYNFKTRLKTESNRRDIGITSKLRRKFNWKKDILRRTKRATGSGERLRRRIERRRRSDWNVRKHWEVNSWDKLDIINQVKRKCWKKRKSWRL